MRRAVESKLRPVLGSGVELLDPVPLVAPSSPGGGGHALWRVLLRSHGRATVAEVAALVTRLMTEARGRDGLKVRMNMDPEEV